MSEVSWDPNVRKFMRKISKEESRRIFDKIDLAIRNDVKRYLESLKARDGKKIRIGNYRLFVTFDEASDLLTIRSIIHRKNAYK